MSLMKLNKEAIGDNEEKLRRGEGKNSEAWKNWKRSTEDTEHLVGDFFFFFFFPSPPSPPPVF